MILIIISVASILSSIQANEEAKLNDPLLSVSQIRKEIGSLISNIDKTILNGQNLIGDLVDQEEFFRQNLVNEINNSIDLEYVKIWEGLITVKNLSEFLGEGISPCFKSRESIIINLPELSRKAFDTCLIPLTERIRKIKSLKETIGKLRKDVITLDSKLTSCNANASCLEQIKVEMTRDQIEIPDQIFQEVQMAKVEAGLIQVNEANCLSYSVSYLMGAGVSIVNSASECLRVNIN